MTAHEIDDLAYSDTQDFLFSQLPDCETARDNEHGDKMKRHERLDEHLADERMEQDEANRKRLENYAGAKKRYKDACCYCGRPGTSVDCYEGALPGLPVFSSRFCPSCGYPHGGIREQEEDTFDFLDKGVTKSANVRRNREWS